MVSWENIKKVLITNYPLMEAVELLKRKRYWFEELRPSLVAAEAKPRKKKDNVRVTCYCGRKGLKANMRRHANSTQHQAFIRKLNKYSILDSQVVSHG